ncbi:hypothetical protein BS78_10G229900 [Paspalum vaginatum]|nr:hypothetical protein BS78_10G229900 [Paspalum vaginatum]
MMVVGAEKLYYGEWRVGGVEAEVHANCCDVPAEKEVLFSSSSSGQDRATSRRDMAHGACRLHHGRKGQLAWRGRPSLVSVNGRRDDSVHPVETKGIEDGSRAVVVQTSEMAAGCKLSLLSST